MFMGVHFLKNKKTDKSSKNKSFHDGILEGSNPECVSADTTVSVDCVVARKNVSARGKIDVDKITHRELFCIHIIFFF